MNGIDRRLSHDDCLYVAIETSRTDEHYYWLWFLHNIMFGTSEIWTHALSCSEENISFLKYIINERRMGWLDEHTIKRFRDYSTSIEFLYRERRA